MDRVLVERTIAGDRGALSELARMSIGRLGIAPQVRLPAEGNVGNGNRQRLP